ncbi:MAG: sulfatase [Lentisphaerales bacterium]|nr:sulfatase [Lentisphaerales bacterium]
MLYKLFLFLLLYNFSVSATPVTIAGKHKKINANGRDAISGKELLLRTSKGTIAKHALVELTFSYLDKGKGDIIISYSSADPLDESLKTGFRLRKADYIHKLETGKWVDYKVTLKNTDFAQNKLNYQVKVQAKGGPLVVSGVSLKPVAQQVKKAIQKDKLNVLMIIIDDLNNYVGAFGDPQAVTPTIDKFVSQGVRFNRAYCQYPVCGPSRASFLSGLYPESSGVMDNTAYLREVNSKAVNMFEHFNKNGYWTGGSGKIFHSKFGMYEKGTSFDEYEKPDNAADPQTLLLKKRFMAAGAKGDFAEFAKKHRVKDQSELVLGYGTELNDDQHGDGRSARKVAKWILDNESGDKPFLMACGIVKPHVPFYAPEKYFKLYPQSDLKFEDVPEDDWANKPKIAAVKGYTRFRSKMGVNDRQVRGEYLQAYLACISFMDAQVKVLLDALEKSGQADNTVVVFMSDHGFHIGEHFMYGKVTLFEECARVPFAIRLPGAKANGKSTDSFAELVDVYPTIVELCGLPQPPHNLQGKSLAKVLQDPSEKVRDASYTVVTRAGKVGRTIRTAKWRFAHWGSSKDIELYDMQDDPKQYNNLAKSPEYKKVVKEMTQLLNSKKPNK